MKMRFCGLVTMIPHNCRELKGIVKLRFFRSTQQCIKSKIAKHFGVAGIQQQNRLVDEKNVTLFAKVLHGFEFEVETLRDHRWNLKRMSIKDLVYKKYREENNKDAFAVTAVDKIYSHESLTFNNILACDVISKWKVGLKDNMDARLDVYVLSNGCRKCCEDDDGYYREYTP
nr:zinc finger, CCHC-type [Tanacetum cinerariifolium]